MGIRIEQALVDWGGEHTHLCPCRNLSQCRTELEVGNKRVSRGKSHRTKFPGGFPGSYEGTLVKVGGENIAYLQLVIMSYNCLILQQIARRSPRTLALDLANMKSRLSNIIILYCQPLGGPSVSLMINLLPEVTPCT